MGLARIAMTRLLASHPGLDVHVQTGDHAVLRHLAESVEAILRAGGQRAAASGAAGQTDEAT